MLDERNAKYANAAHRMSLLCALAPLVLHCFYAAIHRDNLANNTARPDTLASKTARQTDTIANNVSSVPAVKAFTCTPEQWEIRTFVLLQQCNGEN